MRIDNSRASKFHECPAMYQERYEFGIEPLVRSKDALEFGTRVHQLLQMHYSPDATPEFSPLSNVQLEAEAQTALEAYKQYWGAEDFEVVATEQFFEVPLPTADLLDGIQDCASGHTYIGEIDMVVRMKATGRLALFETKTEKRGSKKNLPQAWANRAQVGLYLWAAEQLYGEEFETILLNVITRCSPKGLEPVSFRRDHLVRTEAQKREAVENIVWVADQIESMRSRFGTARWPQDRNQCHNGFWACDYADLHVNENRSEELVKIKFKPAEEYLAL